MAEADKIVAAADKIVAAIFAANMCAGKTVDHATYLQTYDDFIDKMKSREKAKKEAITCRQRSSCACRRTSARQALTAPSVLPMT